MLRASVFNRMQIGAETVPGTVVAASKQLLDSGITPRPRIPTAEYRPMGSKYATDALIQKGFTEFGLEGDISYVDLPYFLSSLVTQAAVAGTWNFSSDPFNPDTIQTYTIEHGSSGGAERFAFGVITALELAFTETEARMRGNGIGREMADGVTMTASPTILPSVIVNPKNVDVLVGDAIGSLTNIGKFYEANWNLGGRFNHIMALDSSQASFSDIVEATPRYTARLVCAKGSEATGYMSDLRSSKLKFMRIKVTDPRIVTGVIHYDLQITFPFKFREPDMGDRQGVYTDTFELIPMYDPTYGKAMEVIVVNGQATL